jgi:tetratricopeptide (TPR) repeat protein
VIDGRRIVAAAFLALGLLVPGLLATGCAAALREPRPIAELAGGAPPADAAEAARLLSQAEALFAERDVEKADAAARLYLRAAAAEDATIEALLGAVRADVWLTDHESDPAARGRAAAAAVDAAQWCARKAPADAACDYWMGAALGVQARERPSTGLSALPQIERAFQSALRADPGIDEAGPDRALALLYLRAPGWPGGPGDPQAGLEHARAAVARRPDYPPNQLALAEALRATGDEQESRAAYGRALALGRDMADRGDRDAPEWVAEAGKGLGDR